MQSNNPGVLGWGFSRLLLRLQLGNLNIGVLSSLLEKDERLILGHVCIYPWKRHALCYAVLRLREEPLTCCVFRNSLGNEIWSIYNAKYSEMWTFYTPCVSVAICGDFCHERARKCTKFYMKSGVTRLGGLPGLPGRVTLSAGVTICHVNVSMWGNPPTRGRVHGKKLKSETRMF